MLWSPTADGVLPTRSRRRHAFGDHQSCLKPFTEDDFEFNDSEGEPQGTGLPSMHCCPVSTSTEREINVWTCVLSRISRDGLAGRGRRKGVLPGQRLDAEEAAVCGVTMETLPVRPTLPQRILRPGKAMFNAF